MITRRRLLANLGAASIGLIAARAPAMQESPAPRRGPRADYFPNALLHTHEGSAVRFYDDLIADKLVVINMMYAQCEGICPGMTANLVRVQRRLGERVGQEVFMYSITLLPEQDTPARLQEYVDMHGVKRGWLFLTGERTDIEVIRRKLGFYDTDPEVDADRSQHTGMVRIGNEPLDRWCAVPALSEASQIADAILAMRTGSA